LAVAGAVRRARCPVLAGLAGALLALGWLGDAPAAWVPVPLGPSTAAERFLDSLGIDVHWDYRDSTYGHRDALADDVAALGIRHVRGYDPAISRRLARLGITTTLPAGPEVGEPGRIASLVRAANRDGLTIDAVEGPNEPDQFWVAHHYSYRGQGFPAGVLAYQRDLADAFRRAPDLDGITLIGPSLGRTYNPPHLPNPWPHGVLAGSVHWGNFHPYPFGGNPFAPVIRYDGIASYYQHGNFPSVNLDRFPYALRVYAPPFAPKEMVATETGYPTWPGGVTEAVQAAYLPRLFAEYFRLGIRRTYLYELADLAPDPQGGDEQRHFGVVRSDLSHKPAFAALRSLTALIGRGAQAHPSGPLPHVSLQAELPPFYDDAGYVHSLLLRQSASRALLLAWHEVADTDLSADPPRSIDVPQGRLAVTVAAPWRAAAWYAYAADWQLVPRSAAGNSVQVPLQDRIVVVALRRDGATP
jgi:hypothetical protein